MESFDYQSSFSGDGHYLNTMSPIGLWRLWESDSNMHVADVTNVNQAEGRCTCFKWKSARPKKQINAKPMQNGSAKSTESPTIGFGTSSGSVLIYNVLSGDTILRLTGAHSAPVSDICWSACQSMLYSCSQDRHVVEWDLASGKMLRKWEADKLGVTCLAYCPEQGGLLTAGRSIKRWDLPSQKIVQKFTGHASNITNLCFPKCPQAHADQYASHFFSMSDDRMIYAWRIELASKSCGPDASFLLTDSPMAVDAVVAGSGFVLVTTCRDYQIYVFSYEPNGLLSRPIEPQHTIQISTPGPQGQPLPVFGLHLSGSKKLHLRIAYGHVIKPSFELLQVDSLERMTHLERDVPKNILMKEESPEVRSKKARLNNYVALGTQEVIAPAENKLENTNRPTVEVLSLEERLNQNAGSKNRRSSVPTAASLAQMIVQAVRGKDAALLDSALRNNTLMVASSTTKKLPVNVILPLLELVVERIRLKPGRGGELVYWVKSLLTAHRSYLASIPSLRRVLSPLHQLMEARTLAYAKMLELQGRLSMLLEESASVTEEDLESNLKTPLCHYIEGDETEEEDLGWLEEGSDQEKDSDEHEDTGVQFDGLDGSDEGEDGGDDA